MEIMDKVHFLFFSKFLSFPGQHISAALWIEGNYISPGIPERRIQTFHDAAAQIDVQISYDKTYTAILERQNTRPDYLPSAVWRAEKLLQQHYDLDYSIYTANTKNQCTTFGLSLRTLSVPRYQIPAPGSSYLLKFWVWFSLHPGRIVFRKLTRWSIC